MGSSHCLVLAETYPPPPFKKACALNKQAGWLAGWLTGYLIGCLAGRPALPRQRHSRHQTTQSTAARHLGGTNAGHCVFTMDPAPSPQTPCGYRLEHVSARQAHVEYVCISIRGVIGSQSIDNREPILMITCGNKAQNSYI